MFFILDFQTCGQSLIPGAYTDVAQYIEWIEERVKQI